MSIQSLSICVPAGCVNDCKFCISEIRDNHVEKNINFDEIRKRMEYARNQNCNTLLLTGKGEPINNTTFISSILRNNSLMKTNSISPFNFIELQTSGVGLLNNDQLLTELKEWGVKTISLSIVDLFSEYVNRNIMNIPKNKDYNIDVLCKNIKLKDFNLRISLNMTNYTNINDFDEVYERLSDLEVDQLTIRYLEDLDGDTEKEKWIRKNRMSRIRIDDFYNYIKDNGNKLEKLPYGNVKYSVNGISTVIDDDCLGTESKQSPKSYIIKEDSKLYTRWDDNGSKIF